VTAFLEDLAVVSATDRDADPAFALHRGGKIEVALSVPPETRDDLSLAYTPGVARICTAIAEEPDLVYDYTWMSRTVVIIAGAGKRRRRIGRGLRNPKDCAEVTGGVDNPAIP